LSIEIPIQDPKKAFFLIVLIFILDLDIFNFKFKIKCFINCKPFTISSAKSNWCLSILQIIKMTEILKVVEGLQVTLFFWLKLWLKSCFFSLWRQRLVDLQRWHRVIRMTLGTKETFTLPGFLITKSPLYHFYMNLIFRVKQG